MANESTKVDVFFHKSNFFRVIHVDGCHGGINPRGQIHCGVFSERAAIPLRTEFSVKDGQPGPEQVVEGKSGIVRELEADLVMDLNTATAFYIWLGDKIEHLRKGLGVSDDEWSKVLAGEMKS